MNTKTDNLELKYSVNALCVLERTLGKRAVDIVEDLEADGGPAIHTLRAVVAAGWLWNDHMAKLAMGMPEMMGEVRLNLPKAGNAIDRIGINGASRQVGRALGEFLRSIGGEA
ncbi:hypothetical protein ABE527_14645 [Brucella sp. TWI432]